MPGENKKLRVIIIGGGLGGLALAQSLNKHENIDVSVYERDKTEDSRWQGYRISIQTLGRDALEYCLPPHLFEKFNNEVSDATKMTISDNQGNELIKAGPEKYWPTSRTFFRELLASDLKNCHFGKRFKSYEVVGDEVIAHFDDGTSVTGDILVGADGGNSVVKSIYLPELTRPSTDIIAVICKVRYDPELLPFKQGGMIVSGGDGHSMFFSSFKALTDENGNEVASDKFLLDSQSSYIFFALTSHWKNFINQSKPWNQLSKDELYEECLNRTKNWAPDLQKLVRSAVKETIVPMEFKNAEPLPYNQWPADKDSRVVLLGDAVHSMVPHKGMGGNQALMDACMLSKAIEKYASNPEEYNLNTVFDEYYTEMTQRGFASVRESRFLCNLVHLEGAVPCTMRNTLLRAAGSVTKSLRTVRSYLWPALSAQAASEKLVKESVPTQQHTHVHTHAVAAGGAGM